MMILYNIFIIIIIFVNLFFMEFLMNNILKFYSIFFCMKLIFFFILVFDFFMRFLNVCFVVFLRALMF